MPRVFALLFTLLLTINLSVAQELEVVPRAMPQPHAVSHNIVFVVDASSTINTFPIIQKKFDKGWDFLTSQFANDTLYFRVYVFHDPHSERRTKWVDAGGPEGFIQFARAKKWVMQNTGTRSWGLKALRMALRDKNPLDTNPATAGRLTIVLFTDGGLTEASTYGGSAEDSLNSTVANHVYSGTGSYKLVNTVIAREQNLRVSKGLEPATIVTIGFQNLEADAEYGMSVKQRDPQCQAWLYKLGKKYHGGNFLIRVKNG